MTETISQVAPKFGAVEQQQSRTFICSHVEIRENGLSSTIYASELRDGTLRN